MRKLFLSMMIVSVALFGSLAFVSCDSSDDKKEETKDTIDVLIGQGVLNGNLKHEVTLDATKEYKLAGSFIVEDGGVLNIPAGTVIKASEGFGNYVLVSQGGKINARGTAEKPITFTANVANADQGHWGGVIINGKAPIAGGEIGTTEINTNYKYGGTVANDNSGILTYVIIRYSGARSSADVEHNGLTLNGVGNGTTIENLYIPDGADDAIEFFGGNVNVKNLLVVNSDDDMFDFTQGYTGTLENAYGIWPVGYLSTEADPRGIEADGNLDGLNQTQSGQSNFTVRNITFDLRLAKAADTDVNNVTNKMQDVIKMRRGAKATIINALVKGTGTAIDLIDFSDSKGAGDVGTSISLTNSLTNTFLGKEINPGKDAAGATLSYPNAKIEAGNTGCPTSIFAWTGYNF